MLPVSLDALQAQLAQATAGLDESISELHSAIAEIQAEQDEQADQPPDRRDVEMLHTASRRPEAPESLRRLAARVERGQLTWAQVIAGSDDPGVTAFRAEAMATARNHFEVSDADSGGSTTSGATR